MTLNTTKPMPYGRINEMQLQLLKAQLLNPERYVRLVLHPTTVINDGLDRVGHGLECCCSCSRVFKHH